MVIRIRFEEGHPSRERTGDVICRFEHSVNRFLALVLADREKPATGKGRLMSRIRGIAIPRFDSDWDTHLTIVRDVVSIVERHEAQASKLRVEIAAEERDIDSEVFRLYDLDISDIATIESFGSTPKGPPLEAEEIQGAMDPDTPD